MIYLGFYGGYTLIIDITDNPVACSFYIFICYRLCWWYVIRKVDMAYITEQLATGDFIKRGPGYVLFHKSNKGEVINFLGYFPSPTTVYQKLGNGSVSLFMVRSMVGLKGAFTTSHGPA